MRWWGLRWWRPIKTARIEGDRPRVLVYGDVSEYTGDRIDVARVERLKSGAYYGETALSACEGIGGIANVTHWMPLPGGPPGSAIDRLLLGGRWLWRAALIVGAAALVSTVLGWCGL